MSPFSSGSVTRFCRGSSSPDYSLTSKSWWASSSGTAVTAPWCGTELQRSWALWLAPSPCSLWWMCTSCSHQVTSVTPTVLRDVHWSVEERWRHRGSLVLVTPGCWRSGGVDDRLCPSPGSRWLFSSGVLIFSPCVCAGVFSMNLRRKKERKKEKHICSSCFVKRSTKTATGEKCWSFFFF